MLDEDFGGFLFYEAVEFFAPLDQENVIRVHQVIEGQSIEFPLGINAVEINVEKNNFRTTVFVDESEGRAGYVVRLGSLEAFRNAFDQRSLPCPQITAQQDDRLG